MVRSSGFAPLLRSADQAPVQSNPPPHVPSNESDEQSVKELEERMKLLGYM